MWTAPWLQEREVGFDRVACIHMSGLSVRRLGPLAKMVCATRVPDIVAVSHHRWTPRSVPRPLIERSHHLLVSSKLGRRHALGLALGLGPGACR